MQKGLFSLILLLSLFSACEKSEQAYVGRGTNHEIPDQESWGNNFEVTIEGKPRAVIWSGYYAKYGRKRYMLFADSIHIDFYDVKGVHQSELFADSGKYFEKNNDIYAWGNVHVVSDSGIILQTQKLHWDNRRQKIISNTECKFYTVNDTLYGDYFESNPDLTDYTLKNPRGVSHRKFESEE